ncbi:NYN domain-containing protein [Rhizobium lusitanum]|uniref:NYN domain-containing protein n=1 Tax=Rhizobium lusitanum TaxID=293958 RepID=UPI00195DFC64|nr:NYN domain-containing protein [Rhizobium lusitanum]MBM7045217.1 NYN domain-containing protein [Rhizobium lusitanum]
MSKKVAVLIDGGHTRVLAKSAGYTYNPDYIEKIAKACIAADEEPLRFLYYDCAPYVGNAVLPVSGSQKQFNGSDVWLKELAAKDLFAIRLGVLKFRGFIPKQIPVGAGALTDNHFKPSFEQKGVDMRIGLDIATYSANRSVERLILLSGDTDCIPAMKHARISGLQVALVSFPNRAASQEMLGHSDIERHMAWPAQ